MTIPPSDHVVWPIVRVTTRAGILLLALWMFYNQLDPRDCKTLLLAIFADTGLSLTSWASIKK